LNSIKIADKIIGKGEKCFIIAEVGVNHNGDIKLAKKIIDQIVDIGADAVKFQAFNPEKSTSRFAEKSNYQKQTTKSSVSQFEMLKKLQLSHDEIKNLKEYCNSKKILFLCTVSDMDGADFIKSLDVDFIKIASPDIINIPLIRHVAKFNLPIILSTGMSTLEEVREAVDVIKKWGNDQIVLLHCVSNYPTNHDDVNLNAMKTLEKEFKFPVGFSDHTLGDEIALAAVGMGAMVLEKHITLDQKMEGPDHRSSMEPESFKTMIKGIRNVEASFGDGIKKPAVSEKEVMMKARRSLVINRDVEKGTILTKETHWN
jgi:sialic acid synthase SpsE